jgi:hypothetical protein
MHDKPNIIISTVLNKHTNKEITQHKIITIINKHGYIKYNNLTNSKRN